MSRYAKNGVGVSAAAGVGPFVPCLLGLALAACGGGSSSIKANLPIGTGTDVDFTPTVSIDDSLTQVNPPTVTDPADAAALPEYSQHLEVINAAGAIGAGLLGDGVTIGLIDTGVNSKHPALEGRVLQNYIHLDPSVNDTSVDDVVGHGTTVAQLAAGEAIDIWGGGVAQQADIVSARIISDDEPEDDGSGQGNEIAAGDGYGEFFEGVNTELADAGARIINNSWGGLYWNDPALTEELADAWRDFVVDRGGLIVFATGNESRSDPSDNAILPTLANDAELEKGWLAVTAVDPDDPDQLDSYVDSHGDTIIYPNACGSAMNYCLAAPGTEIYIDPEAETDDDSYALWQGSGTSFAAPLVSGAAAVVWSAFPYFDNDLVRQTLLGTATDIGAPGVDEVFGWGLLDVSKAANGPGKFAWGDVTVSFSGNSVWRNLITGDGGLIKMGSGTLTLTELERYTGDTDVLEGALDLRNGLYLSNLSIASGATVWVSNVLGKDVANSGQLLIGASTPTSISGSLSQTANGNLGVWLGNPLKIFGTAALDGQVSILGVKNGYTTSAKETLLTANGGVNGTFSSVKSASNVFLDANVTYDTNNVFLNINRIDVSKAVAGMGLSQVTQVSASRVEQAMSSIDTQLAGGDSGISTAFIEGAGALQQVASVAQADKALRSLSGELHAAADATSLDSIDANRRALSARFGELSTRPRLQGDWSQALGEPGQGGFGVGRFQGSGWLAGSDLRLAGSNAVVGFAFGETDVDGYLGTGRGDRSHDRQTQAQFYLGGVHGNAYAMGQVGVGRYERQLRRELWLGERRAGVATDYAGDFFSVGMETGYRFGAAGAALTPYAGVNHVRLLRDGFAESGADGFGLKADASAAERTQAIAGLRGEYLWNSAGGRAFSLHGFAEWQESLSENGMQIEASFVGVDAWSALQGEDYLGSGGVLGVGFDAALSRRATWMFGYDHRFGSRADERQWTTRLRYGF